MIFNSSIIIQDVLRITINLPNDLIDDILSSRNLPYQRNPCWNNGLILFFTEFISKQPPLPLVVLKVHISHVVKIVGNDEGEHNPSVLLLYIDPKKNQEHYQLGNQSDLNYWVKAQKPNVVVHLEIIPVQQLPLSIFSVQRQIFLTDVWVQPFLKRFAHYRHMSEHQVLFSFKVRVHWLPRAL